jgi:hypothetical protein
MLNTSQKVLLNFLKKKVLPKWRAAETQNKRLLRRLEALITELESQTR